MIKYKYINKCLFINVKNIIDNLIVKIIKIAYISHFRDSILLSLRF
jgi:hypothetical protein